MQPPKTAGLKLWRGGGHKCAFLRFRLIAFFHFLVFLRFFVLLCIPCHPCFALFFFVPYMDKFITRPTVAEEDKHEDDCSPELQEEDSENVGGMQEPEKKKVRLDYTSKTTLASRALHFPRVTFEVVLTTRGAPHVKR